MLKINSTQVRGNMWEPLAETTKNFFNVSQGFLTDSVIAKSSLAGIQMAPYHIADATALRPRELTGTWSPSSCLSRCPYPTSTLPLLPSCLSCNSRWFDLGDLLSLRSHFTPHLFHLQESHSLRSRFATATSSSAPLGGSSTRESSVAPENGGSRIAVPHPSSIDCVGNCGWPSS